MDVWRYIGMAYIVMTTGGCGGLALKGFTSINIASSKGQVHICFVISNASSKRQVHIYFSIVIAGSEGQVNI